MWSKLINVPYLRSKINTENPEERLLLLLVIDVC